MNNQLKQLEKLGKDVEIFEKRLKKVFKGVRNEEVESNITEKRTSSPEIHGKCKASTLNLLKTRHNKPSDPKDCQKNCAIVEVKVKTKRHGKSGQTKPGKNAAVYTKSFTTNKHPTEPILSERSRRHCCCSESFKKNSTWGNILQQPADKKSFTSASHEFPMAKQNSRNEPGDNVAGTDCRKSYSRGTSPISSEHNNFRLSLSSESTGSQQSDHDGCCNEQHGGVKTSSLNNKNVKNRIVEDCKGMKLQTTLRSLEETNPKGSMPLKSLDTLHFLIEELRDRATATADQTTQKLIQDIRNALDRVVKTTPCALEAAFRTKHSSNLTADGKGFKDTLAKNNLETQNGARIISEPPQMPNLKDKSEVQLKIIGSDMNSLLSDATCRINDEQASWKNKEASGPYEIASSVFETADKLQLPAKLNINSDKKNQYASGCDEKLKAELEYLNKQLNLQLKSVEGITMKESEYKTLIANLIEKVDKLEAQVTEQSKVAQHFYAQSNALLEQNSVIPVMEKKHNELKKQLQDTIHNYEKLKVEYCMVKLEKEKYYALNTEKEKQISRFKEEIMNIQSVVVQQMENMKKYEGFASASEKVDNILSMIDTQSNFIRSKINGVKGSTAEPVPVPESPTTSNCSGPSRPFSPFSPSVKLNSPSEHKLSPHETGWSEENIIDNL